MFCDKCGNHIEDGSAFCENCGSPVQQQSAENADSLFPEPAFGGNEVGFTTPPNKESFIQKVLKFFVAKKAIFISAIAIILVVTLSVAFYPYAENAFMKLVKSPEGYFQYVVDNNTQVLAKTTASTINTFREGIIDESGGEASMTLELEDAFYDAVDDLTGENVSEYIDWLKSASVNCEVSMQDDLVSAEYGVELNGTELGSYSLVGDTANSEMYVGIPDYNPDYLYMDLGEIMHSDELEEAMGQLELVAQSLPDDSDLEDMFTRYITCIAENVEGVEETSDTLTVDGISQDATKLSVDITGDLVVNAAQSVIEEAMQDEDLQQIIEGSEDITDLSYDDFQEELENALEELEDVDLDDVDDAEITLELYVNSRGEIIGITVSFENGEFIYAVAEDGGRFGFEMSLSVDGGSVSLEGSGDVSGSEYSGEFELDVMGFTALELTTVDFDAEAFKEGVLNGRLEFKAPSIPKLSDFVFIIDSNSSSTENIDISFILMYEDDQIASITCTAESGGASSISVPNNYIEVEDPDDLEDWVDGFDTDAFIDKLLEAGVPDDFVEELEDSLD